MNQLEKAIRDLNSPNKNTRYEACEELRVTARLPDSALAALESATQDPDPLVADAARRAPVWSKNSKRPRLKELQGRQEVARRPLPRLIFLDELETNVGVHLRFG